MPNPTSILHEAYELTSGQRQEDYGRPEDSFGLIARYWSAYLGIEVTKEDVPLLMILLKVARQQTSPKRDNLVDIAGYTRTLALILGHDSGCVG